MLNGIYLNHLRFASDLILMSDSACQLEEMLEELHKKSKRVCLKMNLQRNEIISCQPINVKIENESLESVEDFIYVRHKIKLQKRNCKN